MAILDRLSIKSKLQLLTTLVLIAVSIPTYFQIRQAQALTASAEGELNGVEPVRQLIKLAQLTQHHRGLSAAQLGGNAQITSKREAKNSEVQQQFLKLKLLLDAVDMTDAMRRNWQESQTLWSSLSNAVGAKSLKAGESSGKHGELIAVYFKLLDQLIDRTGLILDPEADSYFLIAASLAKLPLATEALGQSRARGAGFLAEGKIDPAGRALLAGLVQLASDHHSNMVLAFEKSFDANPELKKELSEKINGLKGQVEQSLQLTKQELIAKEEIVFPAADYIASYTKTIDSMFASGDAAMDALAALLNHRVTSLRQTTWTVIGLLIAMTVGIFWMTRGISKSITEPLIEVANLAQQIADRDLRGSIDDTRVDEIGQLNTALLAMRNSLSTVIGELRGNANQLAQSSQELAHGSSALSQRTEQQAAALEQTASSMESLTTTVRSNADQASDASGLAQRACEVAHAGGTAMGQIVATMNDIATSSKKIEEITSLIDGIAFQTNILALNAAVEAARAGEQGRGFAVVATEVRALAQRSAEAAKQIKNLIATSVSQVESGARLVSSAGSTMEETVASIRGLSDMVGRISLASNEQSGGLAQINQAVSHMDQLTQQNAALVEETAASGVTLQEQAQHISDLVNTFQVAKTPANQQSVSQPRQPMNLKLGRNLA